MVLKWAFVIDIHLDSADTYYTNMPHERIILKYVRHKNESVDKITINNFTVYVYNRTVALLSTLL